MTGLTVGQLNVNASLQGVTGTLQVTVNAATLVSVSISPLNVTLTGLLTGQQFALTGHFSDGSTQILTGSAHWTVSSTLLGLISTNGFLTPLSLGNLTVTATYGSFSASASVSIVL